MSAPLVYGQLGGSSRVHVTDDGVHVTDETEADRVILGRLDGGDYGLKINASDGQALIDGNQVVLTRSTGTIPAGVKLGITQTAVTASGVTVSTGGVDRVVLGALGGGDYGLRVVNAGSTVIIDGTSNMFKIQAEGTLSGTQATGSDGAVQTVTLTGLGTLSAVPAFASFLAQGASVTDLYNSGVGTSRTLKYAANSSGGAVDSPFIALIAYYRLLMKLSASPTGNAVIALWVDNHSGANFTAYSRYYVYKEAAL